MSSRGFERLYSQPFITFRDRVGSRLLRGAKQLGVPLLSLGLIAFCGGVGYSAFRWLSAPSGSSSCDRLWMFSPDADKLFCAETAARSKQPDQLLAGLQLVEHWPADHPLHSKVVQYQRNWSEALLAIAAQKASNNDLSGAIQLGKRIVSAHPDDKEAKKIVSSWETNLKQVQTVEAGLEVALWSRDWTKAETLLQNLPAQKDDYLQRRVNRWQEKIATEQVAYQQFQQVSQLVTPQAISEGDAATIGQAIRMALQICPNQYTRVDVQNSIERWSWVLVKKSRELLQQGNVEGAIATLQWIPDHIPLPTDLNHLFWFNRARTLTTEPPPKIPNQSDLWAVVTTLAAIRQIPADHRFYAQTQSFQPQLETRLQDLTQLTLARAIGSVEQLPTLLVATQMAAAITPDRPHRIYGQSLIAEWQQAIQRAEDRPYLYVAQQLAASGSLPDLQAAIAEASQVAEGRALRPEAQAAIYSWQRKLQTLEDQPLLEQAQSLAKQDKLSAAIEAAKQIAAGRALYPEAQALIQSWTTTLQTAEDQPILKQANVLAEQGNLVGAMELAYQIAPGRALYDQARAAIDRWSDQLGSRRSRRSGRFSGGGRDRNDFRDSPDLPPSSYR